MSNEEFLTIQRAQKGDPLALARLHDRYFPSIYRFFYYRIGNPELIAELTVGLFDRMVRRIHTYKAESMKFQPWLYMLAKSLMMEQLLERGLPYKNAMPPKPPSTPTLPLSVNELKSVLSQLAQEERDVLIGKLIERRPTREVAREIGRSVPAVKALQRQGLRHLRHILFQGEPA